MNGIMTTDQFDAYLFVGFSLLATAFFVVFRSFGSFETVALR